VTWLLLWACSPEYHVVDEPVEPPPPPPEASLDDAGAPPSDWEACTLGAFGTYYNLPADHPDVEPTVDDPPPAGPDATDWFDDDRAVWTRFDPSLDFGRGWWPVDDGLEGDPAYFSASWAAWVRVWTPGAYAVVLGAGGDAWVELDGVVVAEAHHLDDFEAEAPIIDLEAGVYPLRVRFAHRTEAADGFQFRVAATDDDVSVCAPELR
jgi:hypothetical protein